MSDFAATIRRVSQRVGLTQAKRITTFIQNLQPEIKNYVLLQRRDSMEEAKMHAKLKESLPDPKPTDHTEEILNTLSKLQTQMPTPVFAAYTPPGNEQQTHAHTFHNTQPLTRDDVTQIIRQELRRTNNRTNTQTQRGRRTFDGRPICDFCQKPGHVMAVCRQRLNQRQDPRIPGHNRWSCPQYNPGTNES